jgi:hypothetical protein
MASPATLGAYERGVSCEHGGEWDLPGSRRLEVAVGSHEGHESGESDGLHGDEEEAMVGEK